MKLRGALAEFLSVEAMRGDVPHLPVFVANQMLDGIQPESRLIAGKAEDHRGGNRSNFALSGRNQFEGNIHRHPWCNIQLIRGGNAKFHYRRNRIKAEPGKQIFTFLEQRLGIQPAVLTVGDQLEVICVDGRFGTARGKVLQRLIPSDGGAGAGGMRSVRSILSRIS